jgi:CheY-like chemotaxis protein
MRILFADDQKDIRLLTKEQLENAGHNVVAVANGEAALRALREEAPFDLILLDEEMPGMTGSEVLRAIRAGEKSSGHIVAIALTGYNTEQDEERLLKFNSILSSESRSAWRHWKPSFGLQRQNQDLRLEPLLPQILSRD